MAVPPPDFTDPGKQSIWDFINQTLNAWGLPPELAKAAKDFVTAGYSADEINLRLQQTDAYKQRFAGNELRKAAGLPVLSPAQYIGLEEQYTNVLKAYGLPSGFYDQKSDFTKLIGNDVDPTELQSRAQMAHDQYMNAPQQYRDWAKQNYGLDDGHMLAMILDPTKAQSLISDRMQQVAIGGTAAMQGFNVSAQRAQQFQQAGVTLAQARQAYQNIGQTYGTDQNIAQRFGTTFGQTQEENAQLLGDAKALNTQQNMYAEERAQFKSNPGGFAPDGSGVSVQQDNY